MTTLLQAAKRAAAALRSSTAYARDQECDQDVLGELALAHLEMAIAEAELRGVSDAQGPHSVAIPAQTTGESSGHPTNAEPEAIRHSFDGYGWMYIDNGHGSGWRSGIDKPDAQFLYTHPPVQAEPLTPERILEIAHRMATKYAHRSDPTYHSYAFVPHTMIDFVRAIEAEVRK